MSSPQEFGIQVAKCSCQERSFHVSVYPPQHMSMSCHVICVHRPHGGVNWSSIRSSDCEREAGISMQSVPWFSQQYHYNSLFTGHVLTSLNSYILVTSPNKSCANQQYQSSTAHPPAVLLTAHPPDTNTKVFDPKPGTDRLEQIYLINHCNLKTTFNNL